MVGESGHGGRPRGPDQEGTTWSRIAVVVVGYVVVGCLVIVGASIALIRGGDRPADPVARNPIDRGAVVSATRIDSLSVEDVVDAVDGLGLTGVPARFGVDSYRISYRTIDPAGASTQASGLVVLPRDAGQELRVVAFLHGTIVSKADAPSLDEDGDQVIGLALASAGFAAVVPDYLGLGTGTGRHPYLHAASETSASVDLLRAARSFAERRELSLDPRILVTGMSQGGHVAIELAHALDAGADPQLRLAAAAPIAGPYDIRGVQLPAILRGEVTAESGTIYAAYWTVSMNRIHHLYADPSEVFRAPYDQIVESLFDGTFTWFAVMDQLPESVEELFTPQYLANLSHPPAPLKAAMEASGRGCAWRPTAPVRLYASKADRDAPFAHAVNCRAEFGRRGVDVPVVEVGDADHGETFWRSFPRVVDWFLDNQ